MDDGVALDHLIDHAVGLEMHLTVDRDPEPFELRWTMSPARESGKAFAEILQALEDLARLTRGVVDGDLVDDVRKVALRFLDEEDAVTLHRASSARPLRKSARTSLTGRVFPAARLRPLWASIFNRATLS